MSDVVANEIEQITSSLGEACGCEDGGCRTSLRARVSRLNELLAADPEPVELVEPVDVVAWLRAQPGGAVLLDADGDVWQLRLTALGDGVFRCVDGCASALVGSDAELADMAAYGPFRVLWTPEGGA